jgi:hypothetical protein
MLQEGWEWLIVVLAVAITGCRHTFPSVAGAAQVSRWTVVGALSGSPMAGQRNARGKYASRRCMNWMWQGAEDGNNMECGVLFLRSVSSFSTE